MTELLRLPKDDDFALTPKIWLALGLLAYNHQLLTRRPMKVLMPSEVSAGMTQDRHDAIRKGLAALVSVDGMSPQSRAAFIEIARSLLEPIGVQLSLHGTAPNPEDTSPRYIAVADTGGTTAFRLIEPELPNQPAAPRALQTRSA